MLRHAGLQALSAECLRALLVKLAADQMAPMGTLAPTEPLSDPTCMPTSGPPVQLSHLGHSLQSLSAERSWLSQVKPAADQVAQNVEPLADRAIKEGVKPAVQAVSDNAEPLAQQLTEDQLKPAATRVLTLQPPSTAVAAFAPDAAPCRPLLVHQAQPIHQCRARTSTEAMHRTHPSDISVNASPCYGSGVLLSGLGSPCRRGSSKLVLQLELRSHRSAALHAHPCNQLQAHGDPAPSPVQQPCCLDPASYILIPHSLPCCWCRCPHVPARQADLDPVSCTMSQPHIESQSLRLLSGQPLAC